MEKTKQINTVIAKAIVCQLSEEISEKVKAKNEELTKQINDSPTNKELEKLFKQREELDGRISALESQIFKTGKGKFSVSRSYNSRKGPSQFKAEIQRPIIKESLLVSEIILLGHEGKTVEQIKKIVSAKIKL
jgi:hypothetical protein